ncbi:hypothetical protein jhhlp_003968 [Lomentospora prolificans]|uniref:ML-like domain-containing protein n=1 Tax=Lomentospora prolificans TaxID=41688 RepID=A0A2N3NAA1_9PEZI|nr:hypothetical protein jhhlp_003968 [Lomentospora prolificans]
MAYYKPLRVLLPIAFLWFALHDGVEARETRLVPGVDNNGERIYLESHRTPALYTGDFGDCGGGGDDVFSITKFDAGLYTDNFTVLFNMHGSTTLRKENVMCTYIYSSHLRKRANRSQYTYGEQRFEMIFDPCLTQVYSMCPVDVATPITAWAQIPIPPIELDVIPSIAYGIPDFDGIARLQIFSNTSQTRIGCFQASLKNGHSLSHPIAIPIVLGFFTTLAILSSFVLAIYGSNIPQMRTHYAHAFSGLIVFEAFHSIFFSGAVSVRWPSVLPAWRSNFAWSAGLIYADKIVDGISSFAGINGNASEANTVGSVVSDGGFSQRLYGRSIAPGVQLTVEKSLAVARGLFRRQGPPFNSSNPDDYTWGGRPTRPGLPLPGSPSGFTGTLAILNIPPPDAFLSALIWFFIFLALILASMALVRYVLCRQAIQKRLEIEKLGYFRSHLPGYIGVASLRAFFIGFTPLTTLALLQLASPDPPELKAIAAVMGFLVLLGVGSVVYYACHTRLRLGRYEIVSDRLRLERGRVLKVVPTVTLICASRIALGDETGRRPLATFPWFHIKYTDVDPDRTTAHEDEAYIKRFGWLTAHYRRTRWWFFSCWFVYQLVRAIILGAAISSPMAQVFGLLLVETIAFIVIARLKPFEGSRNSAAAVWLLGVSKVATAGLSIGFLPNFSLGGIPSTALGIIIVAIQMVLVAAILIFIGLSVISSWMSLTRDRDDFPKFLQPHRTKFLAKMDRRAPDIPEVKKIGSDHEDREPAAPYFSVNSVRREPKIGEGLSGTIDPYLLSNGSGVFLPPGGVGSRPVSLNSRHSISSLRRAALVHPGSRSTADLTQVPLETPPRIAERPNSSRRRPQMSPPLEAPEDQGGLRGTARPAVENKEPRRAKR